MPFYLNNPLAMGTQSPATAGIMRGMGVLAGSPAGAPNMAVPGPGGQMQNLQAMQDQGQTAQAQQIDPATLQRLMQMMQGGGGQTGWSGGMPYGFPGRFF